LLILEALNTVCWALDKGPDRVTHLVSHARAAVQR
jgi:hypothetical protein